MWRFYKQNFVTGLIFNAVVATGATILVGIFYLFVSLVRGKDGTLPALDTTFNVCIFATMLAVVLIHLLIYGIGFGGSREKDMVDLCFYKSDIDSTSTDNKHRKYHPNKLFFIKRIREKKFVKSIRARLTFLPCILLGGMLALIGLYYRDSTVAISIGQVILAGVLSSSATCWIIFGVIGFFSLDKYAYCPKCKAVYSFTQSGISDYKAWTEEETKATDHYGTVAEVYADKKKIGTITGKTHTTYEKRDVKRTSYKLHRKCACCGYEDDVDQGMYLPGSWKQK